MAPFEVVYSLPSPRLLTYVPGTTRMEVVDEVLCSSAQYATRPTTHEEICRFKVQWEKLSWVSKFTFVCSLIGRPLWLLAAPLSFRPDFMGLFCSSARWVKLLMSWIYHQWLESTWCFMYHSLNPSWDPLLLSCQSFLQWILTDSFKTITLSSNCLFIGKDSRQMMLLGKNFIVWNTPTHTLWARCFKREGLMSQALQRQHL